MKAEGFYCRMPWNWRYDPSLCWFEWQTLLSGVLALAAALLASWFLWKQIRQTESFHRDEISRQHNAARVVLPMALASISDVCKQITEHVAHAIEARSDGELGYQMAFKDAASGEIRRERFESVPVPDNLISELQRFVETLTDASDIRHMAELASSVQILLSRYSECKLNKPELIEILYGLLLDAAKVQLLNDKIFNYGKFVDDGNFSVVGTVSNAEAWSMIHQKAFGLILFRQSPDLFFSEIEKRIEQYKKSGCSPWNVRFDG